ncbi:MAG: hypothetical protein J6V47_05275 [Bacteroidaceae bacterium]|nr:hypothetical protein [Bacteroidaceae bacterium]
MGFRADIEDISKDALEYLKRGLDGCKLHLVESLSLLFGDVVCLFVLSLLLFVAYIALMVVVAMLLFPLIGLPLSILAVAVLLLFTAVVVFLFRERLFADRIVRHFVKIFFGGKGCDDGC